MSKKTILEINYKLVFDNQDDYIVYLGQMDKNNPALYNEIMLSEARNGINASVYNGDLAKRTRVVRTYQLGLE